MNKHLRSLHGIYTDTPNNKRRKDAAALGTPALTQRPLGSGSAPNPDSPEPETAPEMSAAASPIRSRSAAPNLETDHEIEAVAEGTPLPPPADPTSLALSTSMDVPAHSSVLGDEDTPTPGKKPRPKPKAKPRPSKAKSQAQANSLASVDEDLMLDPDLRDVLPRIRKREVFWVTTEEDARAMKAIRNLHPRRIPASTPSTARAGKSKGKGKAAAAQGAQDLSDGYDSFDEGVGEVMGDANVIGIALDDDGMEVPVLGRGRWQSRYIMAKAKMMLVDEENLMRKDELRRLMEMESSLDEN
jgi:hypothetical protein